MLAMSHVFPVWQTRPALLRLAGTFALAASLVWCASSCSPRPAYAENACGTPDAVVAIVHTHPNYVTHVILTAAETARALSVANSETPAEAEIESGILILRTDASLIFFVFLKAGNCGTLAISPDNSEKVVRALKGSAA
jgi:hypothetical protein